LYKPFRETILKNKIVKCKNDIEKRAQEIETRLYKIMDYEEDLKEEY